MKLSHFKRQIIIVGIILVTGITLVIMSPNPIIVRSNAEYDYWESDATINFEDFEELEAEEVPSDYYEDEDLSDELYYSSKRASSSNNIKIEVKPPNKSESESVSQSSPSSRIIKENIEKPSKSSSRKTSSRKTTISINNSSKTTSSRKPSSSRPTSSKIPTSSDDEPTSSKEPPYTGMVSLNNGTFEQLCSLDGIGEVIAQRIIDFREASGGFTSIEEVKYVKGIGEATYAAIVDRLTL